MSNNVRELYRAIIENVIRETKNEFEESGDDPAVLDMLRQAWRKRLAGMNVTKQTMWQDGPRMPPPTTMPSSMTQNYMGNLPGATPGSVPGAMGGDLGLGPAGLSTGSDPLGFAGIPQIKDAPHGDTSNILAPGQGNPVGPGSNGPGQQMYIKQEPYGMMPPGSVPPSGPTSSGSQSSAAFNPLDGSKQTGPGTSQNSNNGGQIQLSAELQNQIHTAMNDTNGPRVPQTDGPVDEELNSDLDDSEDELNSNDEDEESEQTQIMLCLYEKVHKVKTRWKYTLRDGVANVNGLDYVFTRATGESEW